MVIKKTYLVIVFFFTGLFLFSQGEWEVLNPPTEQHLRSVCFTDSLFGWAAGDTGTIIHTNDGGDSWEVQDAGTSNNIVHVYFLDRQTGWASSWNFEGFYGTLILKTTDGGNTWLHEPYPEENIFMNCIIFLDSLNGWMGGSPHAIVYTEDGGQSWTQAIIDTSALAFFPVLNIYFYDENFGYACGGMFDIAGVTWSTSDGGAHWQPIDNADAPADEVHGMHLFDSLNVIGAGGDPDQGYGVGMLRTSNGGIDWDYEELSMAGNAFDIDFRNDTEAWAPLGPTQEMIYSPDAGSTWNLVATPASTAIFDMIFTDTMHGYGVGYNGAVIRYIPEQVSIEEYDPVDKHVEVYPNPARQYINIEFIIDERDVQNIESIGITLYDMHSRNIRNLAISSFSGGLNTIRMDVSGIPAGIYFLRLCKHGSNTSSILSHKLLLR